MTGNHDQQVPVTAGAWAWISNNAVFGAKLARFHLDFPAGAERNGADLPAGRVFFTGVGWQTDALEKGEAALARLEIELEATSEAVAARAAEVDHVGWAGKPFKLRAAVLALQERERLRGRVAFHRDWLPQSVVPGPRGSGIALSEEDFLSVKRRRASGLLGEAYDIIGKYRITRAVDASRPATPV